MPSRIWMKPSKLALKRKSDWKDLTKEGIDGNVAGDMEEENDKDGNADADAATETDSSFDI